MKDILKKIEKYMWIWWLVIIVVGIILLVLQVYAYTILLIFGIIMLVRWYISQKKSKEA